MVRTAFLTFCGRVSRFDAVCGGTLNTLGISCAALRAETGKIKSAGVTESAELKYEAASVALKGAV